MLYSFDYDPDTDDFEYLQNIYDLIEYDENNEVGYIYHSIDTVLNHLNDGDYPYYYIDPLEQ